MPYTHSLTAFYAMYGKDYDDHDAEWKTEYEKKCHRRHNSELRMDGVGKAEILLSMDFHL